MDFRQEYYSLEFHLENAAKYNTQFEILNAIWKLNKKNLSSALDNVAQYFPHFSLHEKSHSNTIISNIESFLGEDRIRRLSPTDTWLLLMATYTHDLGMVVFYELIEKQWGSVEFQNVISELQQSNDPEIRESAIILSDLQGLNSENFIKADLSPIKIKNAVTLVVSEYIRRKHHVRSSEILKGSDEMFSNLSSSFYSDQIPRRLLDILGEVAYLHGVNFYETIDRLDYQANGIANDKIHPRFISAMLRLGDLLDIDDGRFNAYTEKVFKFPVNSLYHKQKHSSIKHFLITPETIEITADCNNENSYRLARSWFDWLNEEVEVQSKEWSNIAPRDLTGGSPKIPKGKIKIYYNGKAVRDELLNLKFQISNERIFGILEGSSIYENAEYTFLRELIQNATDASKIELWTKIQSGTYDYSLRQHKKDIRLSHDEIMERIVFRDDIPPELLYSHNVRLSFQWEKSNGIDLDIKEGKTLQIIVEDYGTGISDEDLIRMTSKVGESRKNDTEYSKFLNSMPFWLRPTGAFGIGLQSVFLVTDSFIVHTKTENSDAKEIVFRSSRKGKYSSITNVVPQISKGTKVIIKINENDFPKIFGNRVPFSIAIKYDDFNDKYGNIYLYKIIEYLKKTLFSLPGLEIRFFGDIIKNARIGQNQNQITLLNSILSEDRKILAEVKYVTYDTRYIYFGFDELIIGSEFHLKFPVSLDFSLYSITETYKMSLFVRDIMIEHNIDNYFLQYSNLEWNLLSPESDKILSLNREKILWKNFGKINNEFFTKVVPTAIAMSEVLLFKIIDDSIASSKFSRTDLAFVYFGLLLTKAINHIKGEPLNASLLNDEELPVNLAYHNNNDVVKLEGFINSRFFLVTLNIRFEPNEIREEKQKELISAVNGKLIDDQKNAIIIVNNHFFEAFLSEKCSIHTIFYEPNGMVLLMQEGNNYNKGIRIENELHYFKRIIVELHHSDGRYFAYSHCKYSEFLSVSNKHSTGFERFPIFSNTSIAMPFTKFDDFINLYKQIMPFADNNTLIEEFLTPAMLKTIIPKTLISYIQKNSAMESSTLDENSILRGYKLLITDLISHYHKHKDVPHDK